MGILIGIIIGLYVAGYICYREGRRFYKPMEEHSKWQMIVATTKLGFISYLKAIFMLICIIAPAVVMYIMGSGIKEFYTFSKNYKENPTLTDLIDSINFMLLSIGTTLAIGIAVATLCLGLLIIYRTRKLEKDE